MGNKNGKKQPQLKEKEIKLLIQKSGLTRQEIVDWHAQFLVRNNPKICSRFFLNIWKIFLSKSFQTV